MNGIDEELVTRIFSKYTDDELVNEFIVYEEICNIENYESTLLIEVFDTYYPIMMHELANRYVRNYLDRRNNVVQLKLV